MLVAAATTALALTLPALTLETQTLATQSPQGGGADRGPTGEQIYAKKCASCHGANGAGTKDQPDPLVGDRSIAELTRLIAADMPDDAPEECVGDEARRVAEYIYDAFYSPIAQARLRPPRIELLRLTEAQHRNAIADLLGAFLGTAMPGEERGLQAEYFNSGRSIRPNTRVFTRRASTVDLTFDAAGPGDKVDPKEFAIRFTGAVLAPATGRYDFVVDSPNGVRLWVNDPDTALIDRWVRSGDETRHRASRFLLGGRIYLLRLDVFKEKRDPHAAIRLSWRRPGRVDQVVPSEFLVPDRAPQVFVADQPFPPDDASMGYARGGTVSKAWEEATTATAVAASRFVAAHLPVWTKTDLLDPKAPERVRGLCGRLVAAAFRRPLTGEQREAYVDRWFAGEAVDLATATRRCVILALKSPRFLFPGLGPDDGWQTASRLALALWDGLPDRELRAAAEAGGLDTRSGVRKQIDRMLRSPRTRAKVREFYHAWLPLDRVDQIATDRRRFPQFDATVVAGLRDSLDLLLDEVTWSDGGDYRQLLQADHLYLDGRLARLYGGDLPPDSGFVRVGPESLRTPQAGILTHPLLMAALAHDEESSPIHRGVFVARRLLGRRLRPPPEAVVPLSPELHPELTTRQRIARQTKAKACRACHTVINPLGFALENFDAVGQFRTAERGQPIDATGAYETRTGEQVRFAGARDLARFLAGSIEAQDAFVERLFQHLVKQPMNAYGAGIPEALRRDFAANDCSVQRLIADLAALAAVHGRDLPKRPRRKIY